MEKITGIEPMTPVDAAKVAELFNATGQRSRSLAAKVAERNRTDFEAFIAHGLVVA